MKKIISLSLATSVIVYSLFAQETQFTTGIYSTVSLNPSYVQTGSDDKEADKKAKEADKKANKNANYMPALWMRLKVNFKYDKVTVHARLDLVNISTGKGNVKPVAEGVDKYSSIPTFDRGYIKYQPIDTIALEAGMDSAIGKRFAHNFSGDNDEIIPLVNEGVAMTSSRDIGFWLTYTPMKAVDITGYMLAPKANFGGKGIKSTVKDPSKDAHFIGYDDKNPKASGRTKDTVDQYNITPFVGLTIGGQFLDDALIYSVNIETGIQSELSTMSHIGYKNKAMHFGVYEENGLTWSAFRVKGQNILSIGGGVIGYFGDNGKHEVQFGYAYTNTVKTTHGVKFSTKQHGFGLEGKFRVYGGDQLYFVPGVSFTIPPKIADEKTGVTKKLNTSVMLLVGATL